MPQTRIADDVWDLAQEVSERMGLNSPRLAIEAIVRVCASHYTHGSLHHIHPQSQHPQPAPIQTKPAATEQAVVDDASAALSNLMQSFA